MPRAASPAERGESEAPAHTEAASKTAAPVARRGTPVTKLDIRPPRSFCARLPHPSLNLAAEQGCAAPGCSEIRLFGLRNGRHIIAEITAIVLCADRFQ